MQQKAKTSWKADFDLPVGVSLSAQRQEEVMSSKLGSTPERTQHLPCEQYLSSYDDQFIRGESIKASIDVLIRALQQRITNNRSDNITAAWRRRGSLRLDVLEIEPDRQITFRVVRAGVLALFVEECVATYLISTRAIASCRLLAKLLVRYRRGWLASLMSLIRPIILSYLLRRDLIEIKRLAESMASE